MHTEAHSSWLEIDLGAIRNNVQEMQRITRRPIMAVVKANAYGHGIEAVGKAVVEAGAAWCGVARIEEALALRHSGVTCPILDMGYTPPQRIPDAIAADISLTVDDPEVAVQYAQTARAAGKPLKCHLKVDTGMSRLGVSVQHAAEFIQWLHEQPDLVLEGVFTHFARADEPQAVTTEGQLSKFQRLVEEIEAAGLRPEWVHAANSAAGLYFPEARFDLVRSGIAIYGLQPSDQAPLPDTFRPALSMKTRITHIRTLPAGQGISYGHRYQTRKPERVGSIAIGYADGFRRWDGNQVLLHGKSVPVLGTICMDQCVISLEDVPQAKAGDEVVLIGHQGAAHISAEMLAQAWGTINYEVVCGMASRLPRLYND
ncbi:MAG: alanine racemase [Anaerolineaceae bacterium]|nr:alanine racemase [Anaerolineaceae bacterium]